MKQDTLTFIPSDFDDLNNPFVVNSQAELDDPEYRNKYFTALEQFQNLKDCPFQRAWNRSGREPLADGRKYPDLKYKTERIDAIRIELLNGAESVTVNL